MLQPLTFALLAGAGVLFAQASGTIHGTVWDASGAVLPDTAITITNTGTNQARSLRADASGQFVAPLLPPGTYSVRMEKQGFAPFLQTGILLQVNTNIQVNGTLEVKGATEQVTVRGEAALVQATATNLVQVVDERRIVDLPLNGRNVLQLVTLNAGVSDRGARAGTIQTNTLGNDAYHVPVSINGSRGNGTNFLLDNADHNDYYTNITHPYPNPDAVQEFSIQTSTFDAQYGRGVGGVVNVVTRSGTNQAHGSVFEFVRNYKMNAANFFSGRDSLKRNQFGGTLGGPVYLPKLYNGKDRTFVFGAYQGTRSSSATPGVLRTVPTEAMKRGDLSAFLRADGTGRIRDPNAPGQYLPNNQVPASLFDPVSRRLLDFIPATPGSDNLLRFGTPAVRIDDNQITLRLDHHVSEKQRLSLRYFRLDFNRPWAFIPNNLLFVNAGMVGHADNTTVNHTYSISPRALNDFVFAFNGQTPTAAPPPELDISFEKLGARVKTVPGFPTMDVGITNWSGIGLGLGYYNGQATFQLADTVSYATGKHNLRAGIDIKRSKLDKSSYFLTGGNATFNGLLFSDPGRANAGNSFAEFLMGRVASWRQQSFWSELVYNNFLAAFVQDDIRVTSKLTLNLGLRFDPKFDIDEVNRKRVTFLAGRQSTRFPGAARGLVFQGDAGLEKGIIRNDWNNLAPRVGLAYLLTPKTVIRAAYGIFYDQYMGIMNNRSASAEPFIRQALLTAPGLISNVYGSGPVLDPSPVQAGPDFVFRPYGTYALPATDVVAGYLQNWNFVIERQVRSDLLIRAAYVGSKGTHLLHAIEVNPALFRPGATAANLDSRRIHQPIGGLQLGGSGAWSSYQSLQLTVQKRYGRGVTLLVNYTNSKSIDSTSYGSIEGNTGGPNPFDFNDNRGLSDFDMPQRLVVSGIWELPRFEKRHAALRWIAGGWQSNFIVAAESGTPITVFSGVDNALMGMGGNWADLTGIDWRLPNDRPKAERILRNFNTAAFRTNAVGTFGTGRRNQLRAPGLWNLDYSLFKNFAVHEKARLQLRGEFFNVLNHANLGAPNTTVTNPAFGRITSAFEPRIVQLGLRLVF